MLPYSLGDTSIYRICLENSSAQLLMMGASLRANITSVLMDSRDESMPSQQLCSEWCPYLLLKCQGEKSTISYTWFPQVTMPFSDDRWWIQSTCSSRMTEGSIHSPPYSSKIINLAICTSSAKLRCFLWFLSMSLYSSWRCRQVNMLVGVSTSSTHLEFSSMFFTLCRQREWTRLGSVVYWQVQTILGRDYGRAGFGETAVRARKRMQAISIMKQ